MNHSNHYFLTGAALVYLVVAFPRLGDKFAAAAVLARTYWVKLLKAVGPVRLPYLLLAIMNVLIALFE